MYCRLGDFIRTCGRLRPCADGNLTRLAPIWRSSLMNMSLQPIVNPSELSMEMKVKLGDLIKSIIFQWKFLHVPHPIGLLWDSDNERDSNYVRRMRSTCPIKSLPNKNRTQLSTGREWCVSERLEVCSISLTGKFTASAICSCAPGEVVFHKLSYSFLCSPSLSLFSVTLRHCDGHDSPRKRLTIIAEVNFGHGPH